MSAIFISASPGVTASALSWLIGEGERWGLGYPPLPAPTEKQGAEARACQRALASSHCWKGRPCGLCLWQQAHALMEDLCANWGQRCAARSSAGLPGRHRPLSGMEGPSLEAFPLTRKEPAAGCGGAPLLSFPFHFPLPSPFPSLLR